MKFKQVLKKVLSENGNGSSFDKKESNKKGTGRYAIPAQKIKNASHEWSPKGEEPHHSMWMNVYDIHYVFVDGDFVRDNYHIDFTEGGHYYRYSFIPEDEIWIEDTMNRIDTVATAMHETHERYLMKEKKIDYDTAHDSASALERTFRDKLKEPGTYVPSHNQLQEMFAKIAQGITSLIVGKEAGSPATSSDDIVIIGNSTKTPEQAAKALGSRSNTVMKGKQNVDKKSKNNGDG